MWPELDALSEKLVSNFRGWQVEITANVKSLAKLSLNTLDVRYGLSPSALFGLPEQIQRIFEDLIESFLIGCGLREASFDANREISGLGLFGIPSWLRLARDELLSRRFQEMAVGAGANAFSGSQVDKTERQAAPSWNWELFRVA
ncbi:MAG: hypothetical protein EOO88_61355 [Pedobacter sp.]|nr:MAG: hypothetical protein EOO88_61355 [Pedobacter sp.]